MLAACIAALEEKRSYHERHASAAQDKGDREAVSSDERLEYCYAVALRAVKQLQPAAKGLEEYVKNLPLSEIARIKGIPGIAKLGKTYDRPDFTCREDE